MIFLFFRRRVRRLSVSVVIRRTLCAAAVDPRRITCRSPPAGSVATLPSARESVSVFICAVTVQKVWGDLAQIQVQVALLHW